MAKRPSPVSAAGWCSKKKRVEERTPKRLQEEVVETSHPSLESHLYESVINNSVKDVTSIFGLGVAVHTKVKGSLTCIHIAVEKEHLNMIKCLLEAGADVNSRYPIAENSYTGSTLLYRAAAKGNGAVVSLLLLFNADVNAKNRDGSTALHIAAEKGHFSIVKILLSKGAEVNFENKVELTRDNYEEQFLESKILRDELNLDVLEVSNISSYGGAHSPLHLAVKSGHENIVELLFSKGADVNAINSDGETALSLAVQRGCLAIVQRVLNHFPDVHSCGNKRAFRYAVDFEGKKHKTMIEILSKHGCYFDLCDDDSEFSISEGAITNGHFNVIRKSFGNHAEPRKTHKNCAENLLYGAIMEGKEDVCKFLFEEGASVDDTLYLSEVRDLETFNVDFVKLLFANGLQVKHDHEILVNAVQEKMHKLIKILLENGADVDSTTEDESFLSNSSRYLPFYENKFPVKNHKISPLLVAAALGDAVSVKILLDKNPDINFQTDNGLTPLHFAVFRGHSEVVEILLECGFSIHAPDHDERTPLHLAAEFGHEAVVKLLLRSGAKINKKIAETPTGTGKSVYSVAAEKGHLNVIKTLVEFDTQNSFKNISSKFWGTPLYLAACNGHTSVVKYLLDLGVEVNSHGEDGETVLFIAASNGHVEIVRVLLECGANVRLFNCYNKSTPLYSAVVNDQSDVVSLLLEYGANANIQSQLSHNSPLTVAADKGNLEVVNLLIKSGADVNHCTSTGETALSIALQNGHGEVVKLLLESNAKFSSDEQRNKSLLICAEKGHFDSVEYLLSSTAQQAYRDSFELLRSSCADTSFTDGNGRTALHLAARRNHNDIVQLLLQKSAEPDARDKRMRTPLFLSAEMGHLQVVETLLRSGANIEAADHLGKTALYISAENGHKDISHLLLKRGANVNARAEISKTPLIISTEKGHFEFMEALLKLGTNVNAVDDKGQSALYFAAEHGCADAVNLLLECGAYTDPVAENGKTPLIISAGRGHFEIVKASVKKGANVNSSDIDGNTALYFAAEYGHMDTMNLLLEHGATVNTCAEKGKFPLTICSKRGHLNCVRTLLKFGANIHATYENELTAAHHAAESGHYEVVELLLKQCANINWNESSVCGPLLPFCAKKGFYKTVDVLMKFGARFDSTDEHSSADLSLNDWGLTAFVRALEYCSADVEFISGSGLRALFEVVNKGCSECQPFWSSKTLVQFFVKMKAAGIYSSEASFVAIHYCDETVISEFEESCNSEIRCMKFDCIDGSNISMYDTLKGDLNHLALYVRNSKVHDALDSPNFHSDYPLYGNIIHNQYEKGKLRRQLIDECVKLCHRRSKDFNVLPIDVVESILLLSNNKDLRSVLVSSSHTCGNI